MVIGISFYRVVLEYCKEFVIMWMGIRGFSFYFVCKKCIECVNKVFYISFRGSIICKEFLVVV